MSVHPLMQRASSELQHQHRGSDHRRGSRRKQGGTWSAENKRPGGGERGEPSRNAVIRESGGNERGGSVREGREEDGSSLMQAGEDEEMKRREKRRKTFVFVVV